MSDDGARGFRDDGGERVLGVADGRGFRRGDLAFAITADHGQGAAGEIAQAVGEVAVVAREQGVVAEIAVLAEGHVAQQVIAQGIDADGARDGLGVSDIAFGFAHLLLIEKQPAVGEDTLRQRLLARP